MGFTKFQILRKTVRPLVIYGTFHVHHKLTIRACIAVSGQYQDVFQAIPVQILACHSLQGIEIVVIPHRLKAPHNIALLIYQVNHKNIIFRHAHNARHHLELSLLFKLPGVVLLLDDLEAVLHKLLQSLCRVQHLGGGAVPHIGSDKIHAFVHAEAVDLVRDPPVTEEFSLFLEEHVSDLVASARIFSLGVLTVRDQYNVRQTVPVHILKGDCGNTLDRLFQLSGIFVVGLQLVCSVQHVSFTVRYQNGKPVILLVHNRKKSHFLLPKSLKQHRKALLLYERKTAPADILHGLNGLQALLIRFISLNQQRDLLALRCCPDR